MSDVRTTPPHRGCAADPRRSRGRAAPEPPPENRTEFQRDRDRILHCAAFRRLAFKTQVMMLDEGDHHRTRLTHSLEVAQIARSMARTLGFDEDLTEALALAHDLGHTPFGHTGGDALDSVLAPWGGFDHNVQSLRVVADLETRYLDFDGLNLTWEALEGLAKRHGPVSMPSAQLAHYDARYALRLDTYPSGEAQIAEIADDIAYNAHDLEDAIRSGLIDIGEAAEVEVVRDRLAAIEAGRASLDAVRLPYALSRGLVDVFVRDATVETRRRLAEAAAMDSDDLRRLPHPVVALSPAWQQASLDLKAFLYAHVYRHPHLVAMRADATRVVSDLAQKFLADPGLMPVHWQRRAVSRPGDKAATARQVADYVAGMTDRYALAEHRRLFDDTPSFG